MMESNGRRLGWIAIALGVMALLVALGGQFNRPRWQEPAAYGYNPGYSVAPREGFRPGAFERGEGPGAVAREAAREATRQFERGAYPHRGHGPGFFFPFFLLSALSKLALFGLIAALIWRALQNRRNGGGGQSGGQGPVGPEPGPYTGETRTI